MARERIRLPSSEGGLVRYFEETRSKLEIKPIQVIILVLIVILIEIFLHLNKPLG